MHFAQKMPQKACFRFLQIILHVKLEIKAQTSEKEGTCPLPPLESYPDKSGTYPGKSENENIVLFYFFRVRDHTNPIRKKGKF